MNKLTITILAMTALLRPRKFVLTAAMLICSLNAAYASNVIKDLFSQRVVIWAYFTSGEASILQLTVFAFFTIQIAALAWVFSTYAALLFIERLRRFGTYPLFSGILRPKS